MVDLPLEILNLRSSVKGNPKTSTTDLGVPSLNGL